jgi:hypothetical protein
VKKYQTHDCLVLHEFTNALISVFIKFVIDLNEAGGVRRPSHVFEMRFFGIQVSVGFGVRLLLVHAL